MKELSPIANAKKNISILFYSLQNNVDTYMSVEYESKRIYNSLRKWHIEECQYADLIYAQKGIDTIDTILKSKSHKEIKDNLFDTYVIIHDIAAIGELKFN